MGLMDNVRYLFGSAAHPARTANHTAGNSSDPFAYPTSMAQWHDRYIALRCAYEMQDYDGQMRRALRLFEALDDQSEKELIAQTRRLHTDLRFVVDRNAAALFGNVASLEIAQLAGLSSRLAEQNLTAGQQVWRRSSMTRQLGLLSTNIASQGRMGIEVVRANSNQPYETALALHWPHTYNVEYDRLTGTRIKRVTIKRGYWRQTDPDPTTGDAEQVLEVYTRILTDTEIRVFRQVGADSRLVEEESGPHGLGVVPFVNLVWQPYSEPGHGLFAAHGIEPALALSDSLMTVANAAAKRFGAPLPYVTGATLGQDNAGHFGRWMYSKNEKTVFGYMEPTMSGITAVLATINQALTDMRNTFPSFAVFGGGANASGEALKMRQEAFEAKVGSARLNILPGMAEAVAMAVAMDDNRAHDRDTDLFSLRTGPIIPVNVTGEIDILDKARAGKGLTQVDYVRGLQRLGVVGEQEDPEKYVEQVKAESPVEPAATDTDPLPMPEDDDETEEAPD